MEDEEKYYEENGYTFIGWPETQTIMEYDGFEENSIPTDEAGAYWVDEEWLSENVPDYE